MSGTMEEHTRMVNASDEILGPALTNGRGDDIAILFGDEAITFDRIDAEASRFGNALQPFLAKGDRALLLLKDSPDFIAAFLGIMRIGAVAVPISTRLTAEDLAFVMTDSGANALIIDDDFLPQYRRAVEINGRHTALVAVRRGGIEGTRGLEEVLAGASSDRPPLITAAGDAAFWLYSSGTTGRPKGAIHVHGNMSTGDCFLEAFGFGPGQRVFSSSKLFFAYALGHVLIGGLRSGSTIILFDGWPDGEAIARVVERYQPTIMASVPAFYRSLLRDGLAEQPCFKRVRQYISAGEALPESLYARWLEATGVPIVEGIGATETIWLMVGGTPASHMPGATGKPFPYCEAKLLDLDDRPVTAPDEPGVLWVKMNSLCRGYWQQPQKTAAAFRDGWYRTGDVFVIDGDGWWHHQGRADDLLKISGQWVSPTEIEECAVTVPGVSEAIVVGAQDDDGLVRLTLFLVAPAADPNELYQKVQDKLLGTLSKYKCPRRIVFMEAIPRTATGKARRFQLRNWLTSNLMPRLMRHIGLDPAIIEKEAPQLFRHMQSKCAMCESHDKCAAALNTETDFEDIEDFCPNASEFVTLQWGRANTAGNSARTKQAI
ncbi:MAG TPA: AMP-binding protein [Casimicrobiaceae bacterium]|nr:AMP-binding protein [Casimicrobiaceae bacterium]